MTTPETEKIDWNQLTLLEEPSQPAVLSEDVIRDTKVWIRSAMVRGSTFNQLLKIPQIVATLTDSRKLQLTLEALDIANEHLFCTFEKWAERFHEDLTRLLASRWIETDNPYATVVALRLYEQEMEKGGAMASTFSKEINEVMSYFRAGARFIVQSGWFRDRLQSAQWIIHQDKQEMLQHEAAQNMHLMHGKNAALFSRYLWFSETYDMSAYGNYARVTWIASAIDRLLKKYEIHDVDLFGLMRFLYQEHLKRSEPAQEPDHAEIPETTNTTSRIKNLVDRMLGVNVADLWKATQKKTA